MDINLIQNVAITVLALIVIVQKVKLSKLTQSCVDLLDNDLCIVELVNKMSDRIDWGD